jgi:hypothetical protein
MIRTQVSLDEREYALAKKQAKALGISVAELVRRPEAAPGCATRAWWSPEIPDPANRLTKSSMAQRAECYVDTSALIAFLDKSDSYHALFRRLFSEPPALRLSGSSLKVSDSRPS